MQERLAESYRRVDGLIQESLGSKQQTLDELLKHRSIDSQLQQALFQTITAIDERVEAGILSQKVQVSKETAVLILACSSLRAEIEKEELPAQSLPNSFRKPARACHT